MTNTSHYYATTALGYGCDNDPAQAIELAIQQSGGHEEAAGMHYTLFMVPVSLEQDYEIEDYMPVVDGTEVVERGTI